MQKNAAILRAHRVEKLLGKPSASEQRMLAKANGSIDYGEIGSRRDSGNCKPRERTYVQRKEPLKEGILVGKNGKLFDLEEILCPEANDLGMPNWAHPIVQEAIGKNDYDIIKAAKELQLYFDNKVWLAISPFIYVKKEGAKPAKMLPENVAESQVPIKPEDYGFTLSPQARQLFGEIGRNDRLEFVTEIEGELRAKGAPVDWDTADAVMNFLNTFSVNAYFYYAKEKRNDVMQDVLAGRLKSALEKAGKMDSSDKGNALCWITMACLNKGDVEGAEAIIGKMRWKGEEMDYPALVKATALVAMHYNKAGKPAEAERCFEPVEKMLENGFAAPLLIKWQAIAGLEGRAIQTLLRFAHDYESQDKLFSMLSKIKPFEIDPKDFESR